MKVAIPVDNPNPEAPVSPIFGRCSYFIIFEVENGKIKSHKIIENPAKGAVRGAGIQAAQLIANEGANVLIVGNIGPNAMLALNSAGVRVIPGVPGIPAKEAVEKFLRGELQSGAPTPPFRHRGPPTYCICPACGYKIPHQPGIPCSTMICPRCGARMRRE